MHCKNNGQESLLQLQDITEKVFVQPDVAHQHHHHYHHHQQQQQNQQQNTLHTEHSKHSKPLTTTSTSVLQPENQTKANNIGESAEQRNDDTARTTVAFENGTRTQNDAI